MTPHNSPYVLLGFAGSGHYVDNVQSLDGAYSPGLEGNCMIVRGLNLKEAFQRGYVPQSVDELRKMAEKSGGRIEIVEHPLPTIPIATDSDVVVSVMGGGKGIGDPLDREPERVLTDVINKIFSIEAARDVFGVVIDPQTMEIYFQATDKTRAQIRENRRKKGKVWEGK